MKNQTENNQGVNVAPTSQAGHFVKEAVNR